VRTALPDTALSSRAPFVTLARIRVGKLYHQRILQVCGSGFYIPQSDQPFKNVQVHISQLPRRIAKAFAFADQRYSSQPSPCHLTMAATPLSFEHIKVGPEVEAFAIQLDDCLSSGFGAAETRRRVLRLVNDYYEYATTQASSLRRPPRGNDPETNYNSIVDSGSRAQHASRWEHEAQTWDLLRRLLPLRYPAPADDRAPPHSTQLKSGSASSGTNAGIWQDFLDAEPSAMERLAVLQWLQHNASTEPEASNNTTTKNQMLGRGTGAVAGHHGWIHTKSSIKLRKRLVGVEGPMDPNDAVVKEVHTSETGSPLVTQLDPDAVTRQGRQLQPRDQESERASWRACFEHLRRGSSVDAIRDWCAERDEMWRAAALSVLPLSSATKEADGGVVLTESDADALVLWRRVCFQLCRKGGSSDVYERAVYGALAGDIQSVESVCSSWDDTLFAHYNSLVRSQFDSYLVRQRASSASTAVCHAFPTPELAQSSGGAGGTGGTASIVSKVAQALESVSSPTRPPPSDEVLPIKVLQAAIIAQDLDRLLYEQGVVLSYESTPISRSTSHLMLRTGKNPTNAHKKRHVGLDDHHGLRILAHVTFITSILDRLDLPGRAASGRQAAVQDPHRLQNQENILIGYVSFLRLSGLEDLVPLYCSELQEPRVYEILHNNLIHVDDEIARSQQLELMRKAGLDPLKFVNAQFDLSFAAVPPARGPKFTFSILLPREQLVDFGRQIRTDFLGDDPDKLDHIDDVLIKTLEWQVLVEDAWPGLFSAIVKLYKYFLGKPPQAI